MQNWINAAQRIVIAGGLLGGIAAGLAACGTGISNAAAPTLVQATDAVTGITVPAGLRVELVAEQLRQPTHITLGPDGALYLTQLNGDENNGQGQVVRVDANGTSTVLLENLNKPTGLAFAGQTLYLAARDRILASTLQTDGTLTAPEQVTDPLLFNGRSIGQIALGPDGRLYFQSTGSERDPDQSGIIYAAQPTDGKLTLEVFARGLKNAYAFAWKPRTDGASGQLYATEIGDGDIAGVGQPPEELNVIHLGGNYGWPRCYANQLENRARGGDRVYCSDTDVPLATFAPQASPTGLAYFEGQLIVALFTANPPKLVSVSPESGAVVDFASGFQRPIALLTSTDGQALYVVDWSAGRLYRLRRS